MSCQHIHDPALQPPRPSQSVYREDCTECFRSVDDNDGLDVCLYCFNGGCSFKHASQHVDATSHPLVLNIKRKRKHVERAEPPQKLTKLAVAAETETDKYDFETTVMCFSCNSFGIDTSQSPANAVVEGIMKANTFAKQAEVAAWELELTPCEHTLTVQPEAPRQIASGDLGKCATCDLKENLWLCLTCGNLGCGRGQFGGIGGNSHGLAHYDASKHPVAVKLGSITAEGTADIYCYACDEERTDPELPAHLNNWGINIQDRVKTEKSLTEMQIEQNLRWEFNMTDEEGKELKKVFGQGLTGLKNLGNSCYLNSIVQSLFALPAFQQRYYHPSESAPETDNPAQDLETQLRKLADGLLSGEWSKPDPDVPGMEPPEVAHQRGLVPAMFKHLVGKGHEEFSTMRQQDSFEFLLHLFKLISRSPHPGHLSDPVSSFRFVLEQRLQCLSCKRVRYRQDEQDNISVPVPARRLPKSSADDADSKDEFEPVTLKECLDIFTAPEKVELTCAACGSKDGFTKQSKFATFPQNVAVNARRFELVRYVPTKLDIPVIVSDEDFVMDEYKSHGLQDGEELLPEDAKPAGGQPTWTANEGALSMLEGMGMPRGRAEKALHATGNSDPEAAMNWLLEHMEDADIDSPLDLGTSTGSASAGASGNVSEEALEQLAAMGISAPQARKALRETGNNVERAIDWVFSHSDDMGDDDTANGASGNGPAGASAERTPPGDPTTPAVFRLSSIVCHKGSSIHAGHYVAYIKKQIDGEGDEWVLFNDEKVVEAGGSTVEEMKKFAYVYFFQRV